MYCCICLVAAGSSSLQCFLILDIFHLITAYSLHTRKRSRFGQRHGLQRLNLTSYFYKNICRKMIYLYFYESIFQDKYIHMVFVFLKLNNLKVIHDLYFQCLTQILSKTTFFSSMDGVFVKNMVCKSREQRALNLAADLLIQPY